MNARKAAATADGAQESGGSGGTALRISAPARVEWMRRRIAAFDGCTPATLRTAWRGRIAHRWPSQRPWAWAWAWALAKAIQAARGVATRTPPCPRAAAPRGSNAQRAVPSCSQASGCSGIFSGARIQVQAPTTPEPRNARMDWQKKTNSETRPGWLCIGSPAFRDACVRDARPSAQKSAWRLDPSIHHDARRARRERHDSVGESRWLPVGRAERWRHPQVSKVRWCQRSQRRGKKKEFFALGQDRGVGSEIPTKSSNGRRENLMILGGALNFADTPDRMANSRGQAPPRRTDQRSADAQVTR